MDKTEIILDTALNLFVENGFHGTATSKIAEKARVANGTLFNYFPTKEILIVSLYNNVVKKLDDCISKNIPLHSVSKESFRSLFETSLYWNLENKIELQYLQQFKNSPYLKSVTTNALSDEEHPLYVLIQNGINLVLLKPLPVALLYSLFTAQINGLYEYIISNNKVEEERIELIDETFELLWKMIED